MIPAITPDLYGLALLGYLDGCRAPAYLRRDDGRLSPLDLERYFGRAGAFARHECILLERAAGQVLDLGAGAGRLGLLLRGPAGERRAPSSSLEVTSLDSSPGACDCLRRRGLEPVVEATWQDMAAAAEWHGHWDSIFLLGAGAGMAGTADGLRRLSAALAVWLKPSGQALVAATQPPSGQDLLPVRYRVEYRGMIGEWFSWLLVAPACFEAHTTVVGLKVDGGPYMDQGDDYGIILRRPIIGEV